MIKAPLPYDEKVRHQALLNSKILDTPNEEIYEEFAELASILCEAPYAAVSFIDAERQWFKAEKNLNTKQVSREDSFCGHAILGNDIMIINDPLNDERFFDNPNVIGGLKIRFYAGVPIVSSDGYNIGTVCVFKNEDVQHLSESQITGLKIVANQISKLLRTKTDDARDAEQFAELIHSEKMIAQQNIFKNESKNSEIAYELHENIAQLIAAAKMKIEAIKDSSTFSMEEILHVKEYLAKLLSDVLKLSNSVTPTTFKSADYLDFIERMINSFKQKNSISVLFTHEGNAIKFESTVGLAFYRIIQHQLNYASLTEANIIALTISNHGNLTLLFEHNGKDEYVGSLEANLCLNNIDAHAGLIKAPFVNDIKSKKMFVVYKEE